MTTLDACILTGKSNWMLLPDPVSGYSLITAGQVIEQPLGKAQCVETGLVQRIVDSSQVSGDYYETGYAGYYDRPGSEHLNLGRYDAIAGWMADALEGTKPTTILDVGCGTGQTMEAIAKAFPDASIVGIEPSRENSARARGRGLRVTTGLPAEIAESTTRYDFVYSNNVLQHADDPVGLMREMRNLAGANGLVCVTCPDATVPSNEILWSDQKYSLLPEHLSRMGNSAGLRLLRWRSNCGVDALNEKQLALFTTQENNALSPEDAELPCVDSADLYAERRAYLETWPKVDAYLLARAKGYQRIICFGAGTWCQLLGAYCPGFWAMVSHCVVDDFGGNCLDKRVEPFVRENVRPNDLLVLATPPATQEKLEPRFRDLGISTVLWNDFIQR